MSNVISMIENNKNGEVRESSKKVIHALPFFNIETLAKNLKEANHAEGVFIAVLHKNGMLHTTSNALSARATREILCASIMDTYIEERLD